MSLAQYKRKRDFAKTREPHPRVSRSNRKPIFVIQEHHASRLHYDFRLEAGGVLKSWAVPKQPTLNPSVKRLAVHVEDHPLEYAHFSGEIPRGEYGAGRVKIWDNGTYENLLEKKAHPQSMIRAINNGHIEVKLNGRRLKGAFALIRLNGRRGKDNWLLIKMKDDQAQHSRTSSSSLSKAPTQRRASRLRSRGLAKYIQFTNEDKIWFPEAGITKGDVLRFYQRISERLLPHLRDRPITVERMPDGLANNAPHFWQKNTPSYYPSWIPRIRLKSEDSETVDYALVNNVQTLLYMVNQGAITFHPWFSRVDNLDQPDYVLFDLDPGEATFADAIVIAKKLHHLLSEEEDVPSVVKTSGKDGLHVLVPWQDKRGYDGARSWALQIAERVGGALSEIATVERSKAKRRARVYVDVMQNARGRHAVPPFVLRAVQEAAVSTPLNWSELSSGLEPGKYTLKTIFRRLAHQKIDPFADFVTWSK